MEYLDLIPGGRIQVGDDEVCAWRRASANQAPILLSPLPLFKRSKTTFSFLGFYHITFNITTSSLRQRTMYDSSSPPSHLDAHSSCCQKTRQTCLAETQRSLDMALKDFNQNKVYSPFQTWWSRCSIKIGFVGLWSIRIDCHDVNEV